MGASHDKTAREITPGPIMTCVYRRFWQARALVAIYAGEPQLVPSPAGGPARSLGRTPGRRRSEPAEACRQPCPGGSLCRGTTLRWRGAQKSPLGSTIVSEESSPVSAGAVPSAAGRARLTPVDAPVGHRPQAVQVVAGGPRFVPRPPGRLGGVLGEPARRARPLPTAPQALPLPVGLAVPAQDLRGITPQQSIDDVCWLGLVNTDQLPYPQTP
jgi:hypothetical protein